MRITEINRFFRKVGEYQLKYRWFFLIFALLLLLVGMKGMKKVNVVSSNDQWFNNTEAIEIATKKFEDQFGNNESIALLIEADNVFHPKVLKMIEEIGDELLEKVPYSDEITSLTEIEISVGTEEGIEVINPFEDGIPEDLEELKEIEELVLSRKSIKNKIVSSDAKETWLILSLMEYPEREEWEKSGETQPMFLDGEAAIAVVTDKKWKSDLYTIKAVGMPYTETEERDYFGKEAKLRVMSGFVVMIVLLIIFLRSLRGVLVPTFTTISGIIVVFGFMGWLNIAIDSNFMTLPVLLGMALSVGYSIHLVNSFKNHFRVHGKRKEACIHAVEETGWPIFFTAVTTIGSVMSFAAAGIIPITWLGFTCAAVVFTDYIFIALLIPILMSFGKDKKDSIKVKNERTVLDSLMEKLGRVILKQKKILLVAFMILTIVLLPGISKISVNMDMFKFMGLKIPYVARIHSIVNSQLGSYISYNVVVDFEKENAIKDVEVLKNFEELMGIVAEFDLTKKNEGVPKIFSVLDIIKDMNQSINEDKKEYYEIPEENDLIAQLLFLYEISGGTKTLEWVDEDYSMLRARVELWKFEANGISEELNSVLENGKRLFPNAKVEIIGSAVKFAEINNKIVFGELKSFLTALIVIGILLMIVFSSVKTGLIGMIPNLTPLVVIGGYMGYTNTHLDMMSMTIIPMLLGIAVDDTIHFITHIKYEYESHLDYTEAIIKSFRVVGKTLCMTTIILAATFGMYMFSPIAVFFRVGLLASLGLTSALVADFIVTPILIFYTKPFGRREKEICQEVKN